jgi:hypothetical protein
MVSVVPIPKAVLFTLPDTKTCGLELQGQDVIYVILIGNLRTIPSLDCENPWMKAKASMKETRRMV